MKTLKYVGIICLFAFVVISCDKSSEPGSIERDNDGWVTQKDMDSWENEVSDTVTDIIFTSSELKGMRLFMTHCNKCHPGGEKGKGPSLIDKKLPDFLIHFQIRNGLGEMPAFKEKDLSKEQVKQIISFVKLMRKNY